MSNVCQMCGKGKAEGGRIIHKGLAKKAGGIGLHVVKNGKRTFEPNIQNVRINDNGTVKTVKMCTACIRNGNYSKA
ncbi:50S ribosomal protein L28 [Victivallis sp. Marseille-Q1083]|uniref:50S ribosomal protein L28 n=1 Tax=Victivallis sp. Marseille-Q1083 TaxID=2717288 RepID=UPI00158CFEDC|nr:50S ribosomal protein L28 [Victivallis sp. Marseille-Q1083]